MLEIAMSTFQSQSNSFITSQSQSVHPTHMTGLCPKKLLCKYHKFYKVLLEYGRVIAG